MMCAESECPRPHYSRGYCRLHHTRLARNAPQLVGRKACTIEGCQKGQEAHGYCYNHARCFRLYGDPLKTLIVTGATVAERLRHYSERDGECVVWTGLKDRKGYGRIGVDGAMLAAHRVAYAEANGDIPGGLLVRHKCDNPPCINTAHLELGTHADNARDMVERGRSTAGERNPGSKLTDAQAADLYRRGMAGEDRHALAAQFGINVSTVYRILAGDGWTSATGAA